MPESDDYAAELRGEEEPMNVKSGGFGAAIVAGVAAALGATICNRLFDHSNDTTTATAIARLEEKVGTLGDQLSELTKQPYVRRDEFETRFTGLDRRIDQIEQRSNSHR